MESVGPQARTVSAPRFEFVTRGSRADPATIAYAREKVMAAARVAPRNVRSARVTLTFEKHRSIERPAKAEALVDVDGRIVHAEADARSLTEAIDLVEHRLRRRLDGIHRRRTPEDPERSERRGGDSDES